MKPIRIIIVDDEKRIRNSLVNILKLHYPNAVVVAEAENVQSAIAAIETHNPDVVLLDIKMPGGSGFDLLKKISPIKFKLIFITAFDQYAIQAFKFSALDYLLKPVIPRELVSALQYAEEHIAVEDMNARFNVFLENIGGIKNEGKKIILNSHETIHVLSLNEIIRCEADRNYTIFHVRDKKTILVSRSLKEYDDMLCPFGFFRCHHSHLVNLSFIEKLEKRDGGMLIMKDGAEVPVASRKYSDLLAALNSI